MAFDARNGKNLWRYSTGTPIWGAAPMTFMLDGRQHIVIASGTTLLSGEGLVATFTGPGTLWLQTRSPADFVGWLIPQLPTQRS